MPTNVLAGFGLRPVANRLASSPTYQMSRYRIKSGYATRMNCGDLVKTGTVANQGYVTLFTANDIGILGVLCGIFPFFDTSLGAYVNQAGWPGTNTTSADIDCWVCDDPFAVFQAQMSGTWAESYRGQNINFAAGTNGLTTPVGPSFISGLYLDATTISTVNTLPFKILSQALNVTGGPLDPVNTNPWIEVKLNTAELTSSTGI